MIEPSLFSFAPEDLDGVPTAVYVARTSDGAVLYVGFTGSLANRMVAHKKANLWWSQAASITVEMWPSCTAAMQRETILIEQFDPPYNRVEKRRECEETLIRLRHDGWPLGKISSHLGIDYTAAVSAVTRLRKAGRL